jgi:uncharacterized SAM-binding protein YcdF (DUF218 family)
VIRATLSLLAASLLVLMGAFVWFVLQIPAAPLEEPVKADAIIVLTGGNGRVEQGLVALASGDAPVLFISGVGERVTRWQMVVAHSTPEVRERIAERDGEIVLDYIASTTRSNADQAAEFVHTRNIHSIRLVTASYHMPRSLLEFRLQMPDVQIIADPVFPADADRRRWWNDAPTRKLVFSEFGKYFAALFLRNKL